MSSERLVPSGFPSLDRAINGGFRAGDLIVLGGDAGSGTSSLALAIALNASNAGCLFLTGEMSSDHVAERALAIEAQVAFNELRANALDDDDREKVAAAAQRLRYQSPIVKTLDHGGMTAVLAAVAENPDVRLVIVDGLESLLTSYDARDDQLAFVVLSLKRLAIAARVAVVVISHLPNLDRQRVDRRPRLEDFGARGACAVHADFVFGLYREEIYLAEMALKGATELLLLKWRDGETGYVDLFFQAESLRFEDVLDGSAIDTSALDTTGLEGAILETGH